MNSSRGVVHYRDSALTPLYSPPTSSQNLSCSLGSPGGGAGGGTEGDLEEGQGQRGTWRRGRGRGGPGGGAGEDTMKGETIPPYCYVTGCY